MLSGECPPGRILRREGRTRRGRLVIGLVVGVTPVVGVLPAAGVTAGPGPGVVRVSGPSPYAGCSTRPAGGTVYPQAEVEPFVSANRARPGNVVGVWQQDRWSNGAAHGLAAGYSFDGGRSWRQTTLPFDRCAPGGVAYDRASDPWVSFGPDGTAYAVALSLNLTTNGPAASAVVAATSLDGGRSWRRVRSIQADPSASVGFNDKESITADPTRPGHAYVVWDRQRPTRAPHFRVPTMFSQTSDAGRTWSRPRAIAATGRDQQSIGNVVLVDPATGVLYDFYTLYFCTCPSVPRIQYVNSTDGGRNWGAAHTVTQFDAGGVTDPVTGEQVRTADFGAQVGIDPATGRLYVAWQSRRFSGGKIDEIALTASGNGGRTWSVAQRVSSVTGRPAFTPTIAVTANGTVGVTYYDFRRLAAANRATLPTDYWLRTSRDGGRTFSVDQHVAGPFNMKAAPVSTGRGFFIGDYQGLTSVGGQFLPVFVQTNCTTSCPVNRTDVSAAHVTPLPAGTGRATAGT